jgi:hypothetical protein
MDKAEIIDRIDSEITNKVTPRSISPTNVAANLKRILNYFSNTDVIPEGNTNKYFKLSVVEDMLTAVLTKYYRIKTDNLPSASKIPKFSTNPFELVDSVITESRTGMISIGPVTNDNPEFLDPLETTKGLTINGKANSWFFIFVNSVNIFRSYADSSGYYLLAGLGKKLSLGTVSTGPVLEINELGKIVINSQDVVTGNDNYSRILTLNPSTNLIGLKNITDFSILITQTIDSGDIAHSPSGNIIFNALSDKANLVGGNNFTGGLQKIERGDAGNFDVALSVKRTGGTDSVSKNLTALFYNDTDVVSSFDTQNEVIIGLKTGTTTNHRRYFSFLDYQSVSQFLMGVNAAGVYIIYDGQNNGGHRMWLEPQGTSGNSYFNALTGGSVLFGMLNDGSNNIGTGGIIVGSGGSTPIQAHRLYGDGRFNFGQLVTNNTNYLGTIGNTVTGTTSTSQGGIVGRTLSNPTANAANVIWGINWVSEAGGIYTQNSIGGANFTTMSNSTSGLIARLRGVNGRIEVNNSVTLASGITSEINVASGVTLPTYIAFDSTAPTGTGTITTAIQFRARDFGTTGFLSEITAGSGKRNISVTGTAPVYFAPRLLLGSNLDDGVNGLQVTGSAIFTGAVTGVTPTLSGHLATKGYVDTFAAAQLKDFYLDTINSGTTETDLYSYSILANRLNTVGEKIKATYSGTFNDLTAVSELKVYFGATLIAQTGLLTVSALGVWTINVDIIKTSATTAKTTVTILTPTTTIAYHTNYTSLSSLVFSNANILKITGTASGTTGGGGDITSSMGSIVWYPAAI